MDEKTLVEKLSAADTVSGVMDIAKKAGKDITFEQADEMLSRILQVDSDAAELSGDSVAKVAKDLLGL
ncbi:hypothetical protein PT282_06140 [Bifidobacterium sp. ESL0763]|uniref:hypothetical protein n=1 Tax=Bifidobacterium sp. ESL0763 TaxID=2983227 RepID=UPI0023F76618|nr:hypothetical protein [Bifidobacterium sp. ESL0763]MDF7664239.1 hypothetical protein [Bifidobacterium sp. ESL0763]